MQYLKHDRALLFPPLAIAEALHKQASYDPDSQSIIWEGASYTPPITVVNGTPYVAWRDLQSMAPDVQFGMRGETAYFQIASKTRCRKWLKHPPTPAYRNSIRRTRPPRRPTPVLR